MNNILRFAFMKVRWSTQMLGLLILFKMIMVMGGMVLKRVVLALVMRGVVSAMMMREGVLIKVVVVLEMVMTRKVLWQLCRDAKSTEEIKNLLQEFITNHFPSVEPEVKIPQSAQFFLPDSIPPVSTPTPYSLPTPDSILAFSIPPVSTPAPDPTPPDSIPPDDSIPPNFITPDCISSDPNSLFN